MVASLHGGSPFQKVSQPDSTEPGQRTAARLSTKGETLSVSRRTTTLLTVECAWRSVHPFSLLEYGPTQGRRRWGAFGVSIAAHGLGLGLVVVLGLLFSSVIETVHQKPPPVYIDLVTPPKQQARAPMPPRPVWKMEAPKLSLPPVQAPLAPPLRAVPRLEQPKVQALVPPKVQVVFPSAPHSRQPKAPLPSAQGGCF